MNPIKNGLGQHRLTPGPHSSGQAFFKWLAIVALLAAAGAGYALLTSNRAGEAERERLRAESAQELAKQNEELERLRVESKEIERLRAESQEVIKLRAESAQLRALQAQLQKLQAENQKLSATIQQLQQVGTENSALRNQNQQLQGAIADRAGIAACIANLKVIENVKAAWAAQAQKQLGDVPLDTDLFGPGRYLPQKPACPSGGVYTVGAVGVKPACSAPGHVYQQ